MTMRFKVGDTVCWGSPDDGRTLIVKIIKILDNTKRYMVEFNYDDGFGYRIFKKVVYPQNLYLTKQEFYTKRIAQYNH